MSDKKKKKIPQVARIVVMKGFITLLCGNYGVLSGY